LEKWIFRFESGLLTLIWLIKSKYGGWQMKKLRLPDRRH